VSKRLDEASGRVAEHAVALDEASGRHDAQSDQCARHTMHFAHALGRPDEVLGERDAVHVEKIAVRVEKIAARDEKNAVLIESDTTFVERTRRLLRLHGVCVALERRLAKSTRPSVELDAERVRFAGRRCELLTPRLAADGALVDTDGVSVLSDGRFLRFDGRQRLRAVLVASSSHHRTSHTPHALHCTFESAGLA
jgi:hypothetical protein